MQDTQCHTEASFLLAELTEPDQNEPNKEFSEGAKCMLTIREDMADHPPILSDNGWKTADLFSVLLLDLQGWRFIPRIKYRDSSFFVLNLNILNYIMSLENGKRKHITYQQTIVTAMIIFDQKRSIEKNSHKRPAHVQ